MALAFALAACARDPFVTSTGAKLVGNWRIEHQVDRVTGTPVSSALAITRTVANSAVLFPSPAVLQLTCFRRQPIVRLSFPFKVGSNRNSELAYRFDDKPGHVAEARFLMDYKTVVIEDPAAVAQFVAELATSKVFYLHIRSLNAGRSSAEFQVEGGATAVETGLADCPVAPAARVAATTAPSSGR